MYVSWFFYLLSCFFLHFGKHVKSQAACLESFCTGELLAVKPNSQILTWQQKPIKRCDGVWFALELTGFSVPFFCCQKAVEHQLRGGLSPQ